LLKIFKFKIEMRRMIEKWREYVERIATSANEILGECEVYVFGSVIEGKWSGGSDVDILIISNRIPKRNKERGELKAKIEEKAGLPLIHPFEIHVVRREEAAWYWKHIKKAIRII